MRPGLAILLALGFSALLMTGAPAVGAGIPLFSAESQAQAHCPSDEVVWLNLPTGIYHIRGSRWYGATKSGVYVCRAEADRAGYRASRNG
jgi:hypothetical protein